MFSKYLSSIIIVTSSFTIVLGQTPEPKPDKIPAPQAFSFSFDSNGAYLGVQTAEVTKENFAKFGLRAVRGVAVEKVLENSPAAAAGLREGDVIVRFNNDDVTSTRKLTRLVSEVEPDHQVKLTVSRGGSEQEITATLAKRPAPKFAEGSFNFPGPGFMEKFDLDKLRTQMPDLKELPKLNFDFKDLPNGEHFRSFSFPGPDGNFLMFGQGHGRQIGVGVDTLTKQLAQHYGVDGGVMINEVRDGSPASRAGIKAGDIVIDANGQPVANDLELIKQINNRKEGDVTLTILRDGKRQTITVTPEAAKDGSFFFKHDDGDGKLLTLPQGSPAAPPTPPAPMSAPLTMFRHGRII